MINTEFRTCEPVLETLRQICLRKIGGTKILIDYLIALRNKVRELDQLGLFKEKEFGLHSF